MRGKCGRYEQHSHTHTVVQTQARTLAKIQVHVARLRVWGAVVERATHTLLLLLLLLLGSGESVLRGTTHNTRCEYHKRDAEPTGSHHLF